MQGFGDLHNIVQDEYHNQLSQCLHLGYLLRLTANTKKISVEVKKTIEMDWTCTKENRRRPPPRGPNVDAIKESETGRLKTTRRETVEKRDTSYGGRHGLKLNGWPQTKQTGEDAMKPKRIGRERAKTSSLKLIVVVFGRQGYPTKNNSLHKTCG